MGCLGSKERIAGWRSISYLSGTRDGDSEGDPAQLARQDLRQGLALAAVEYRL